MTRLLSWLFGLVACVACFDVPSAFVFGRAHGFWLALAAGLATFPIVPLLWHALGERRRKAKPPAKPTTSGWERLGLRVAVVGVLTIGGLVAVHRMAVWRAVRAHALWFIPASGHSTLAKSSLIDLVPPTAEVVLWLRSSDEMSSVLPGRITETDELVAAVDGDNIFVALRGSSEIAGLVDEFAPLLKGMHSVPGHGEVRMWSTGGWAKDMGTTRPVALLELANDVPADADIIALGRPHPGSHESMVRFVGYAGFGDDRFEASAELVSTTEAAAERELSDARRELGNDRFSQAQTCWNESGGSASLTRDGVVVRGRVELTKAEFLKLARCVIAH